MKFTSLAQLTLSELWELVLTTRYPLPSNMLYLINHSRKVEQIKTITHYPPHIVTKIMAVLEIGRKTFSHFQPTPCLNTPFAIYQYTRALIYAPQEIVRALYLNNQLQVVGDEIIAMGNLNTAQINVRELLRPAILYNAHTFVIIHNHPAGDQTPSADDCRLTKYIAAIGAMINIPLQDHLIIAAQGYYSLRSEQPELFTNND